MALILTNAQTNDAKILYLTDGTTWDSDSVPALADVTSASLKVSYKTPDLDDYTTEVSIDILSVFTAAGIDTSLLIFPIIFTTVPGLDADAVGVNELPDGIWKITYLINDGEVDEVSVDIELLLDMQIKTIIYKDLAQLPAKYLCANNYYTKTMDDILLEQSLYYSMGANAYIAKKDEILNTLGVLQRMTE